MCDRFHDFRSPSDNVFISSFLLLAKGTLTLVGQFRPMNWVLVKDKFQKIVCALSDTTDSKNDKLLRIFFSELSNKR